MRMQKNSTAQLPTVKEIQPSANSFWEVPATAYSDRPCSSILVSNAITLLSISQMLEKKIQKHQTGSLATVVKPRTNRIRSGNSPGSEYVVKELT